MFKIITKEIHWNGHKLRLETGKIARQADAAVVASLGETVVLCTVVASKTLKSDLDFLALTVNYQEKFYAAGKIPGGFIKRETRPSNAETLTARLIDRPLRPLFPKNYHREIQVVCTVMSYDGYNQSDIVALIGSSAALWLSGLPIIEPIAGVRVGYKDKKFFINPSIAEAVKSDLDLVIAGTEDSIFMVESAASELSEKEMLDALKFGKDSMQPVIKLIKDFAKSAGADNKTPRLVDHLPINAAVKTGGESDNNISLDDLTKMISKEYSKRIEKCFSETAKLKRNELLVVLGSEIVGVFVSEKGYEEKKVKDAFEACKEEVMRHMVLKTKKRIDGRGPEDIRNIDCSLDILPRIHGSALFTRGETQALVLTTLGTTIDEQMNESIAQLTSSHFMLHYNFPPYSVGEIGILKAPGRREIGHGQLALKALLAVMPNKEEFPYTVRIVSEITESNGSSSMATVCGSSLSLMMCGVPIKSHVAGIAMGLIKGKDDFVILSDIMGDEDHLGDMDFKIAATKKGITALQMDIKIQGIDFDLMKAALEQGKKGIKHILAIMEKAIEEPKKEMNPTAPRIEVIKIPVDKIRDVIGQGGKVIKEICEKTGAKIDISDDGKVSIAAVGKEMLDNAINTVKGIVEEPEVGKIYDGTVVKLMDFGAFVKILPNKDGLLHISELSSDGNRVKNVGDHLKENQKIKVKIVKIDRDRIQLSIKGLEDKNDDEQISIYDKEDVDSGKHQERQRKQNSHSDDNRRKPRRENNINSERGDDHNQRLRSQHKEEGNRYENSSQNTVKKKRFF